MASIRSSGNGKAAMSGDFGGRATGVERQVGEFLNLLGLSASTQDEEATSEADAEKDQDDECDEKFHHGWGHCAAAAARIVSDDESGYDRHW